MKGEKIKDKGLSDIGKFVNKLEVLLGVKDMSDAEYVTLSAKLRDTWPEMSYEDIELAIDLVNKGEFEYDLELYGKALSITFISGLIKKYKAYKQSHPDFKKIISLPAKTEPTENEQYQVLKNGIIELWEKFSKGEDIFHELKWYFYSTLDKYCDLFNPSQESKLEAMERAKPLTEAKLKADREKAMIAKGYVAAAMPTRPKESQVKDKAKELLMVDFFKGLKEMDMELELPEAIQPKIKTL